MARAKWIFGAPQSPSSAGAKAVSIPPISSADAKKYGLENFGNTCYANSVIQALYFCTPFRELLLQAEDRPVGDASQDALPTASCTPPPSLAPVRGKPERRPSTSNGVPDATPSETSLPTSAVPIPQSPPTLFSALRSLYLHISTSPSDKGTVAPRAFIDKVREGNEIFRTSMHQDAHEFLNYLLNKIVEEVEEDRKLQHDSAAEDLSNSVATLASGVQPTIITATTSSNSGTSPEDATLVHKLFEGILTSETRCLTCETVSSRDESFLDLSIDIEQNSSVTACLRQFSASEMLCHKNKFFCDSCCDLQEAEKRMKIKKLPNVLALHLKRFKYQEDLQKYIKLAYRVAFPFELRLFNTVDDTDDADRLFNLFAIVVHIGNGPHHGHYISIIKTGGSWLVFDDDTVYPLPETDIPKYFGESNAGSAYVLYYQAADIDLPGLGIRQPSPVAPDLVDPISEPVDPYASPVQLSNPPLPPGLVEEENSSDLSDPPFPITPSQSSSPLLQPSDKRQPLEIKVADLDDFASLPTSAGPSSPSAITPTTTALPRKGLFGTVKRRPSTSASAAANGPESRQSLAEKSGMPPVATAVKEGEVTLPPRPPTSPGPGTPREWDDRPRHKDPERKSSIWFKRKSFKAGEKPTRPGSEHGLSDVPSSPVVKDTGEGSSSWFKTAQPQARKARRPSEPSLSDASVVQSLAKGRLRPKSSGGGLIVSDDRRRRQGDESSSPAGSVTSSVGSFSPGPSALSTSPPSASGSFDFPPSPKGGSLDKASTVKYPKHEKSFPHLPSQKDKAKDLDSLRVTPPPRPATATGTARTSSPSITPPVPPIPHHLISPESPPRNLRNGTSNGHATPDKGKSKADRSHTPYAPSLQTLVGSNSSSTTSTSSSTNGASHWKRTSRKLSLTAPMLGLGFGKGKKEREREKEKEGKGLQALFHSL
ncbi:cysteine proteinase [Hymenopellis radicata]|nr:cysteine proteinase [Hymenopellis radicata]